MDKNCNSPISDKNKTIVGKFEIVITILVITIFSIPITSYAALNDTLGDIWKKQCKKEGGSRYGCCQEKDRKCRDDGNKSGDCSKRYKICTSKRILQPNSIHIPRDQKVYDNHVDIDSNSDRKPLPSYIIPAPVQAPVYKINE